MVFKILFAHPKNNKLLISLLTAVLKPQYPIVQAQILNPEIPKDLATDKGIILDVFVKLQNGSFVNIEMQSCHLGNITPRILYYWGKTFISQLVPGKVYGQLNPVTCITFLNYKQFPEPNIPMHTQFLVMEKTLKFELSDLLHLHFIELPKVNPYQLGKSDGPPDILLWARFLSCKSKEELRETAMTSPILKEALDAHSLLSLDPENRILAETRQKALLDLQSFQFDAMQEGLQKGLQKGRAEGQREAMILVAKRLLKQGHSLEQISMITELNPDEIQKLLG